jgi:predicted N-acetyltransferase YhbS
MNISIRPEQADDIDGIYELNRIVFGQDNEARLIDHIRQGPDFIPELSLVAIANQTVIGYILLSKVFITNGDNRHESLGLVSIMVHPDHQRKGIGAKLITQVLQTAAILGYTSALVFGHELYYPKFGFLPAARWNIKPPFDAPADAFLALELVPNSLSNVSGVVAFPVEYVLA